MKLSLSKAFGYSLLAVSAIIFAGFTTSRSQAPRIVAEPDDEMFAAGGSGAITVQANYGEHYQWLRNGTPVPGATQPTLGFEKVEIKDAGNYSCAITGDGKTVNTRVASVMVYTRQHAMSTGTGASAEPMQGGDQILLYACPTISSGSLGTCPGNYAGFVMYTKTPGWGYSPIANSAPYTASDDNRSDTIVQYGGRYGDVGCNQTTITIPTPLMSSLYRFAIYFPSNVPTTNYPITLTGFNP